ncbi:MAG: signal peptidase I [Kiritimatiellae bacterium]|nr:signal peptidase I [Kiritimatiellia bacterium]
MSTARPLVNGPPQSRSAAAATLLTQALSAGGEITLQLSGLSMEPAIRNSDSIVVHGVAPGRVRVGDVVLFRAGSDLVAHRVIRRRTTHGRLAFQTKGDMRLLPDAPESAAGDLLGRVTAVRKDGQEVSLTGPAARAAGRAAALYGRASAAAWCALCRVVPRLANPDPAAGARHRTRRLFAIPLAPLAWVLFRSSRRESKKRKSARSSAR